MEMEDIKLNARQKAFADNYIATSNMRESYKRAGYDASNDNSASVNATRLMKNENVLNYIAMKTEAVRKLSDDKLILEQQHVLQKLTEIALFGETEGGRIRALELIGKKYAMFTDKVEHEGSIDQVIIVDDIPDEQTKG